MITLAHIYRHPIKAHGSERLDRVALSANATLPWDRVWAVTHEGTQDDGTADWARCRNFSRGASSPQLMAITSQLDVSTGMLALSHPDRPDITIHPDTDGDAFIDWVSPLMPAEGRASTRLIRADSAAKGQGLTDNPEPYVSILNLASLRALSQKTGRDMSVLRFRGNLWVEGAAPWEEFDWLDQTITIGGVRLAVEGRIDRCRATEANPQTGKRDTDTLGALRDGWGHIDFGVFARVLNNAEIAVGDPVQLAP